MWHPQLFAPISSAFFVQKIRICHIIAPMCSYPPSITPPPSPPPSQPPCRDALWASSRNPDGGFDSGTENAQSYYAVRRLTCDFENAIIRLYRKRIALQIEWDDMNNNIKKMNDFYALKPNSKIMLREFCFFSLDKWTEQGYLKPWNEAEDYDKYLQELFGFDEPAVHDICNLGWCEAGFSPCFEEKVIESTDEYEIVLDFAGRHVKCFKGKRNGFMPEYIEHPVKDMNTWEKIKWRMDAKSADREWSLINQDIPWALESIKHNKHITQRLVGGYMYLRSLMGPLELTYMFYDDPDLIHACMKQWFELADAVISKEQELFDIDELFIGEDICYNHGSLISPEMIKEFLFPYYQQLLTNIKKRNKDKTKGFYFQLDTDGKCETVIDLYKELGMNYLSPFEVASGSDVVEIAKKYPDLLMLGGIDKRILAKSKDDISAETDRIMSYMAKRGGYIPTCDHGVPEEVPFENYVHFRNLLKQYG